MARHPMSEWLIAALGLLVLPMLVLMVKGTLRWARAESNLERLISDMLKLVKDNDRVHTAIFEEMRNDRQATDRRLRWLEEHLWKKG